MLIVQSLGAPRTRGRLRRRPRPVEPSEQAGPVPLTRATVAGGERFGDRRQAAAWLEAVASNRQRRATEVRDGVRLLNRALHALRAGASDPLVQDVGATGALAMRIGYGSGDELAQGRWTDARQLPPPRQGRLDAVDPHGRVAAVLSGRGEVHPAETMLLRARLDLHAGRLREAAWQLRAAVAAIRQDPRLR